jgi:hypothetical protein
MCFKIQSSTQEIKNCNHYLLWISKRVEEGERLNRHWNEYIQVMRGVKTCPLARECKHYRPAFNPAKRILHKLKQGA